jgi:hypothetical protein
VPDKIISRRTLPRLRLHQLDVRWPAFLTWYGQDRKALSPDERRLAEQMRRHLNAQRRDMLKTINASRAATLTDAELRRVLRLTQTIAREQWAPVLARTVKATLGPWLITGMRRGNRLLPADLRLGADAMNVTNPEVARFIERYPFKFAGKVNSTTVARLRLHMTHGLERGETIREIAARVDAVFGNRTNWYRSQMIARTESSRAQNYGQRDLWKRSEVVAGQQWLTQPDCCEFCETMNGKIVSLEQDFHSLGSAMRGANGGRMRFTYEAVGGPPLHPHCRCTTVPVLKRVD